MDQHGEYLIRLAYFYVKDWAVAEDIMQETFISYYRSAAKFEKRASLKTYLSKITINKCHDHLRSWKNRFSFFSHSFDDLTTTLPSPEKAAEDQESQDHVGRAVLELPVKYREVILLYYYQEFNTREISELIGYPENTVKTRLRRAKELLRNNAKLRDWEGFHYE